MVTKIGFSLYIIVQVFSTDTVLETAALDRTFISPDSAKRYILDMFIGSSDSVIGYCNLHELLDNSSVVRTVLKTN